MEDKKTYTKPNPNDVRVGGKVGRLLLLKDIRMPHGNKTDAGYLCRCECGNETMVLRSNLLCGSVVSCGCFHKEVASMANRKHRKSGDRVYRIWAEMKSRCLNNNNIGYERYGGRGIKVCDRWKDSFESFLVDMGEPPGNDYTIDRIDNNGDYEPSNCRWATPMQQSRNRRSCIMVEYGGEKICVAELAERLGISSQLLRRRIKRGWDLESAINTPSDTRNNKKWFVERKR